MSTDAELLSYAQKLSPDDEYIKSGNMALQGVIETLKTKQSTYGIDRVCISGSIGKHTALKDSDYDAVLFINNTQPHNYKNVLEYFESILKPVAGNLKITNLAVKGRHSVQFVLDGKYDVDLLVAANYVHNTGAELESHGVFQQQQIMALRKIAAKPDKYYDYSSCLAESQVQFMNLQSSATHSLVRLVKLWLKKLSVGFTYRSGVKTCLELIAVYTSQENRGNGFKLLFRKFLENIQNIDVLKISMNTNGEVDRAYSRIPANIRNGKRFVVDPANPFNDLSQDISLDMNRKLKEYAGVVLRNLNANKEKETAYHHDFGKFLEACAQSVA